MIEDPGHCGQKTLLSLHLSEQKLGKVMHTRHPSISGKYKIGRSQSRPDWAKSNISRITRAKSAGRMAQEVK
jgi:hypothetical protein